MKPLFGDECLATDCQSVESMRIVNRFLRRFNVRYAGDLPEDEQLRLTRDLKEYFAGRYHVGRTFREAMIENRRLISDAWAIFIDRWTIRFCRFFDRLSGKRLA